MPDTPQTDPKPANDYQERVDKLTRKATEAETTSAALSQQNEALTQQVLALAAKIDKLGTPTPAPVQQAPDLFGRTTTAPQVGNTTPQVTEDTMRRIVQEAMQPFQQSLADQAKDAELANQHRVAFGQAVESFPALGKQDSEEWKVFSQIWDNRPELHSIPDAPLFVAEAVRGVTLSARQEEKLVSTEKQIANVTRPGTTGRIPLGTEASNARELKDKLVEKGETRGFDDQDMDSYLKLKFMEQSGQ